ncbi:Rha family transcriptional regulator [Limosilactobacillus reuteri]|uniref:Rha family transcriptional regulator n=1 Tax=Limosilactobacillus reuteri TaxID=1598 RepID=UPI001E62684E|nr:Rha family transcriptional regulator [Limosilactobacillus reuteri]MCC4500862.1 Rha family transcriptional regulator [Limosilactobacillus reuteri]MCC4505114.1 Rha family transcriptional regulator [Limosilactobacillus reuteri]MCC4507321.1 Rha family transcriptional regulator [Limosilactobacillus reuteri]
MTEELVIMRDRQAVTTSLQVARVFDKRHDRVIRAIEAKMTDPNFGASGMFVEGSYTDASGKANKMYYMNRDGFTFIAFGFTGAKADQFKLKYIDAFNRMEKQLQQQKPLTLPEQISLIAKGYESLSADVEDIKNRMGLPSNMALAFSKKRNAKIINVLGGKKSNAYCDKTIRAKTYRALFSSYRETFDRDRYNDLPMKDFDKVIDFVNNWYPPFELQQQIQMINAQLAIV